MRQTATQGLLWHGPEYKAVVPRDRDLVRDEQQPPPPEVRLPAPAPSLQEPDPGPEVGTPLLEEGFVFNDEEEASTDSPIQAAPPVEPTSQPVEPPLERSRRS